jgi:hypothetical protein
VFAGREHWDFGEARLGIDRASISVSRRQPAVDLVAPVSHLPAAPEAQEVRTAAFEPPVFEGGYSEAQIARRFTSREKFRH